MSSDPLEEVFNYASFAWNYASFAWNTARIHRSRNYESDAATLAEVASDNAATAAFWAKVTQE